VDTLGVPAEFSGECKILLDLFVLYVRGFEFCTQGVFYAEKYKTGKDPADKKMIEDAIAKITFFIAEIDTILEGTDYPHYIYWLLDRGRLKELTADLKTYIG
jgi:hypothetical protein